MLGGDQLDKRAPLLPAALFAELAKLKAPLGVFAVWGNHDYASFGKENLERTSPAPSEAWPANQEACRLALQQAGITVLNNTGVPLRDDIYLGGVDDLWNGVPNPAGALAGAAGRATILLSHNPDILPSLPLTIGLVLCGHTHGGQVRFPFIGAPVVPSQYGQTYAMGWVSGAQNTPAYVGRGLGVSGVPIRNMCKPEIVVLTLVTK